MQKHDIFHNLDLECTVCGNTIMRGKPKRDPEENVDFHYKIAPSIAKQLRLRKDHLDATWNGTFRALLAGYDAYKGMQERQRIQDTMGLRIVTPDISQEE